MPWSFLSTPHGELETFRAGGCNEGNIYLSTPHGELETIQGKHKSTYLSQLSTPHGELETGCPKEEHLFELIFQLHTVN